MPILEHLLVKYTVAALWLRICTVSLKSCVGMEESFLQSVVGAIDISKDVQVLTSLILAGSVVLSYALCVSPG